MRILNFPYLNRKSIRAQQSTSTGYNSNMSTLLTTRPYYGLTSSFAPLFKDTISFGALKKTNFEGIDFAVVEKFKVPIEKFKTNDDLQTWAKQQLDIIINKDFGAEEKEVNIQRKTMLKEWSDYVLKERNTYRNTTALLILSAITKDLKPNNDKLPPVLNKDILANCISEIDKNIKADKKYQFNLNKMYLTKLRKFYLEDSKQENGNTGWVIIPSKKNDPEHFEENVKKLKTLSYKNWCTASYSSEVFLSTGDFHIYIENGEPKLTLSFLGNEIDEIQGELNNNEIPLSSFDKIKKHIENNNLKLAEDVESEFKRVEKLIKLNIKYEKIKNDLQSAIETNDVKAILEYFGTKVEQDDDGMLTISNYTEPIDGISFSDLRINENELFKKIKRIDGNADFGNSKVTDLGNLQNIGEDAIFSNSRLTNLGNLLSIGGDADFDKSNITNLGNLQNIGEDVDISRCPLTKDDFSDIEVKGKIIQHYN